MNKDEKDEKDLSLKLEKDFYKQSHLNQNININKNNSSN